MFLHQLQKGLHTINWNLEDKSPHPNITDVWRGENHLPVRFLSSTLGNHPVLLASCSHAVMFICSLHFLTESSTKYTKSVPSVYFLFSFSQFSKVLVCFSALRGKKKDEIILEIQESFHSSTSLQLGFSLQAVKFCTLSSVIHSWLGQQGLVFWGREQAPFLEKSWLKGNHVYHCSPQ